MNNFKAVVAVVAFWASAFSFAATPLYEPQECDFVCSQNSYTPAPWLAPKGCDIACAENVKAVFDGPNTSRMDIAVGPTARVSVTWSATNREDLKPVTFVVTMPVPLKQARIESFAAVDACNVKMTLVEKTDNDGGFTAYGVTGRNIVCQPMPRPMPYPAVKERKPSLSPLWFYGL